MFQDGADNIAKISVAWIGLIAGVVAAIISFIGVLVNVCIIRKNTRETLDTQREIADESRQLQIQTTERNAEITAQIESGKAFFTDELEIKKQDFQKELEINKHVFQKEIELIKANSDDENAEKKARRDYEYVARQRLYSEIEPLLFQLAELGEGILYRIAGLAGEARTGNIRPDGGWLSNPREYYATSNMYKVIAPLAIVKLMHRKLTGVDLTLVPRINKLYKIARFTNWVLTDDFEIAKISKLPYDPNNSNWLELRSKNQSVHWRQGIPTGRLDKIVDSIIDEPTGRCKSFGNFENEFYTVGSPVNLNFEAIFDIFYNFHPQTRPVLWRILIVQAHLYHCILQNQIQEKTNDNDIIPVMPFRNQVIVYGDFNWKKDADPIPDDEVFVKPFEAAEKYLLPRLKDLYQEI